MNKEEFIDVLKADNIIIDNKQMEQLEKYYEILISENEKINLTNIVEKNEVYLKHFYDSLTLSKIINLNKEQTLCDVGTGAGFPGLVLKIVFPCLKVVLVDSLNKRVKFLNTIIASLNLNNIETNHSRIEDYAQKNREKFDIVVARAVAPLNILSEYCIPITKEKGYFIAMKGKNQLEIENSINAINKLGAKIEETKEFELPFERSSRTLIKIKKLRTTPKEYPRLPQIIKKRPL